MFTLLLLLALKFLSQGVPFRLVSDASRSETRSQFQVLHLGLETMFLSVNYRAKPDVLILNKSSIRRGGHTKVDGNEEKGSDEFPV